MKDVQKFVMDEIAEAKPLEPPPPPLQAENDENRSSTDALTKLLQDAKMDVREKLKRPSSQERQPFTHVNNFWKNKIVIFIMLENYPESIRTPQSIIFNVEKKSNLSAAQNERPFGS